MGVGIRDALQKFIAISEEDYYAAIVEVLTEVTDFISKNNKKKVSQKELLKLAEDIVQLVLLTRGVSTKEEENK